MTVFEGVYPFLKYSPLTTKKVPPIFKVETPSINTFPEVSALKTIGASLVPFP